STTVRATTTTVRMKHRIRKDNAGQGAQWERATSAGFIACGECVIVCVLLNISLTATRRSATSGVGGGRTVVGYGMFNIAPIVDIG
ncbi:hypothetical protein POSPLADRAFT_1041931, partial [Postia placenta MAD-698-R-SB12]